MTAEVALGALGASRAARWKSILPAFCAVVTVLLCVSIVDVFGFQAKPWFGFWDCLTAMTERPFVAQLVKPTAGGAAASAGINDGDRVDLLDRAIEKLRTHTDARAAAVLLDGAGAYGAVRWYGETPAETSENDGAILALKAEHKAVDPHHYRTTLQGDAALPMVACGRVLGVVLCGPRAGGEAYVPDEIGALAEFAQGLGSALDSLERTGEVQTRDDALLAELRALRAAVERGWPGWRSASDGALGGLIPASSPPPHV